MTSLSINPQINQVKTSATLAINELIKEKRRANETVTHLGFGQSPFKVPESVRQALIAHAEDKNYLPGEGLPELRQAVSQYYHTEFKYNYQSNDVFIAPGSKETLFQLLYLLEGPLLLPAPSWVSYAPQANLLNKNIVTIETGYASRYGITAANLKQACLNFPAEQQKILLLNSPNNPSGLCLDASTLKELAPLCEQYNIIIISDEIYAGVLYEGTQHHSMADYLPQRTIVTAGLSKLFSAGGYRLGFSLIPEQFKELKQALRVLISETYSCVSAPIQWAAVEAYRNYEDIKPYLLSCNAIHQMTGMYLFQSMIDLGLQCHQPQGGFYLLPSFSPYCEELNARGIHTDQQLCDYLLQRHNLALLPGSDFLLAPEAFCVRVASVDYDGNTALQAPDIEADCFQSLRQGMSNLAEFIYSLQH